jgi:hypothetical protein
MSAITAKTGASTMSASPPRTTSCRRLANARRSGSSSASSGANGASASRSSASDRPPCSSSIINTTSFGTAARRSVISLTRDRADGSTATTMRSTNGVMRCESRASVSPSTGTPKNAWGARARRSSNTPSTLTPRRCNASSMSRWACDVAPTITTLGVRRPAVRHRLTRMHQAACKATSVTAVATTHSIGTLAGSSESSSSAPTMSARPPPTAAAAATRAR